MKKRISLLLVLCLAFLAAAALADSYAGTTWYLVRGSSGGTPVNIDGTGMSMTLVLGEDGSFTVEMSLAGDTQSASATWTEADGVVTLEGLGEMKPEGDEMVLQMDSDNTLYFSQTPPEPAAPNAPAVKAESAAQFDGSWAIRKVTMLGIEVNAADVGMEEMESLVISGGSIIAEEDTLEGVFNAEDGTLVFTMGSEDYSLEMVFALLEDGSLLGTMDIVGYPVTLLYVPAT